MNQPPAGLRWPDDTSRPVAMPGIVLATRILVFVQATLVAVLAMLIVTINKGDGRALGGAGIVGLISLALFALAATFAPGRDSVRQVVLLMEGFFVLFDLLPLVAAVVTGRPAVLFSSLLGLIIPGVVLGFLYTQSVRRYFRPS